MGSRGWEVGRHDATNMKLNFTGRVSQSERHEVTSKCDLLLVIIFNLQESEGVLITTVNGILVSLEQ